jgi:hypothetical protein
LGFCFYLALLVHALIERECRQAMSTAGIRALPLYPEDRGSAAPTAARLLDQFTDLATTSLTAGDHPVKTIPPQLNPLQRKILDLLHVPAPNLPNRVTANRRKDPADLAEKEFL